MNVDNPLHGISLPLSSLRTENSLGIGDFFDLLPLIDWCKEIGAEIIQLLPLNDTAADPSPYNPVSSCALHPIYLTLRALPYLNKTPELVKELSLFNDFNALPRVSYAQVLRGKLRWLRKYFAEAGSSLTHEKGYREFLEKNSWVLPYARYKALQENSQDPADIAFYCALQYLCNSQLRQVKKYAGEKGIRLKGDISFLNILENADHWWKESERVASEYYDFYAIAPAEDFEPLQLWWQKYPEAAKAFAATKNWTYAPWLTFEQRRVILRDRSVSPLQEFLAFFPELISPHPEEERINIPGTVLPTNWTYRTRTFFSEIAAHQGLRETMASLLP